jgi:lysozyme
MKLSTTGMELLKSSEGFHSHVHLDASGIPIIGYGHRLLHRDSFPNGIDEPQAANLLACDVRDAEQAVQRLVKAPLTQGQFDALVDFCFNLGAGRLIASTLLKCVNAGRYDDAAEQLLLWDHAGGQECSALKGRRDAENELWRNAQVEQQAAA